MSAGLVALPFVDSRPPDWASGYGQDEFGYFADFSVSTGPGYWEFVTQRMRWIPPGNFRMGRRQDEPTFLDKETQHEVTLSHGYWLADTACTQELWEAVTGGNPSHFQGELRPVEQVSFDDVTGFLVKLNRLLRHVRQEDAAREGEALAEPRGTSDVPRMRGSAGASPSLLPPSLLPPSLLPPSPLPPSLPSQGALMLPTEAQWEYACRAGTTTPFSFGETITTDQVNFDGNHPYGDSPKGEYRQQTVDVKALPANPWGLYQMHGNVWEWCSDWYAEYSSKPQTDPTGPEAGSYRVFRGGGWFSNARDVRSACRLWIDPGDRGGNLGFRLLSSASPAQSDPPNK